MSKTSTGLTTTPGCGPATASAATLRATLSAAERLGLSRKGLLQAISINAADLDDEDGRVPLECLAALDGAIRQGLGPTAPLRIGETMGRHPASIVEYLCQCSRTLREFFESVCRYRALTMEVAAPLLQIRGGRAAFGCVYSQNVVATLGSTLEKDLASWLTRARQATGQDWAPLEVHLQTASSDAAEYQRFFRAPVFNDAPGCWLVFDTALLDLPIVNSDVTLLKYLQPIAETMLSSLTSRRSFASSVQATMTRLMRDGNCNVDDVARALAVSPRTLQRRLESEGTTFGALVDDTRRATALEYLKNPQVPIKEAAFRVGFSEPSTFYRAFRRWTGATPAHYRRSLAA